MSEGFTLEAGESFWETVAKMVAAFTGAPDPPAQEPEPVSEDGRPPIRFITLEPYSTYAIKQYTRNYTDYSHLDIDGDDRTGQEYTVLIDGDNPVDVAITHYEAAGNHKQLISFVGDSINAVFKLILDGEETPELELNTLTETELIAALETLPGMGRGNLKVTVWPGRLLVEFAGRLAGESFSNFTLDIPEDSTFEVHVMETKWADSRRAAQVVYPIPLEGEIDSDDSVVNDAVAAGSFGTAKWIPGDPGWVVDANECREFNGYLTPDL